MRSSVFLSVLLLLAAGCVDPERSATAPLTVDTIQYGSLVGRVTDDELLPLANVTLTLIEEREEVVSRDDGSFQFDRVPVGPHTLAATHPLFEDHMQVVAVDPQASGLNLTLVKRPEFRPSNETLLFEGSFECGAEAMIVTGPCWILVEGITCGEPINNCVNDPLFGSKYDFRFLVLPRWETVVAELVWTNGGATSLDGMRLYVENTNVSQQGMHGKGVSKVYGNKQPLTTRIDRGTPAPGHETYDGTSQPAFIPDEGGLQQVRVFPKGQAYDYTRQVCSDRGCFLGLGAGLNVRFTVYVTIFYNEAAPPGYSAVPA